MLGQVQISDFSDPYGSAIRAYEKSGVRDRENYYAALLQVNGNFKKSTKIIDRYLKKNPDDKPAKYLKALNLLVDGKYKEGFKLYENRFSVYPTKSDVNDICPQWDGKETNKIVLVWQEGGFGDILNFIRFFPEVLRRAPNALLLMHPDIIDLLEESGIPSSCLLRTEEDFASKDVSKTVQCSIQSMMYVLGITQKDLVGTPYLVAPNSSIAKWKPVMADKPKIGFCWRGNPNHERDLTRSIDWDLALEFGERHDVFSLMQEHLKVDDWCDTAGIISHLDLVITVDTAVAHLAAAMGKPTWVLLTIDVDWRWGQQGTTSPWYDSARLFRCKKHGDWQNLLHGVSAALE